MNRFLLSMMVVATTAGAQPIVLEELSPAVYLHNRNAKPQLARAMERAGVEVAMRVLANPSQVEFADDDAYPPSHRHRLAELRPMERIAVLQAALMVVADRGDAASAFAAMMPYTGVGGLVRPSALERLGTVNDARVVPTLVLLLDDSDDAVAGAARAGLGRQRSEAATTALLHAWATEPAHRHSSTLLALQQATSPSAHQARGTQALGKNLAWQVCAAIQHDGKGSMNDVVILRALQQRCR
jgi:hypothetical protein